MGSTTWHRACTWHMGEACTRFRDVGWAGGQEWKAGQGGTGLGKEMDLFWARHMETPQRLGDWSPRSQPCPTRQAQP